MRQIACWSPFESFCSASNQRSPAGSVGVDGGDGTAWLGAPIVVEATALDDVDGAAGATGAAGLADEDGNTGARTGGVFEAPASEICGLFGEAERSKPNLLTHFHLSRFLVRTGSSDMLPKNSRQASGAIRQRTEAQAPRRIE
jgi:hypothetical protein